MKHMKLHHVGIVMNSMERAERFMEKFGLENRLYRICGGL